MYNKFAVLLGSDQYANHNDKNSNKITQSGIFIIISKIFHLFLLTHTVRTTEIMQIELL